MKLTRPFLVAAALAVALAGAAFAGVVAHKGAAKLTVNVTEKEFHIALSSRTGLAGSVRFVVRNRGKLVHALAIAGPGIKLKRTVAIRPGRSAALLVSLRPGTYSLWCPVPGHADRGMKTTFSVHSAGAGGVSTGSSGTTAGTTTASGAAWG